MGTACVVGAISKTESMLLSTSIQCERGTGRLCRVLPYPQLPSRGGAALYTEANVRHATLKEKGDRDGRRVGAVRGHRSRDRDCSSLCREPPLDLRAARTRLHLLPA